MIRIIRRFAVYEAASARPAREGFSAFAFRLAADAIAAVAACEAGVASHTPVRPKKRGMSSRNARRKSGSA